MSTDYSLKSASNSCNDVDGEVSDASNNREEDYENETFEDDSQDESFEEMSLTTLEKLGQVPKRQTSINKTFSSAQIREIERQNAILMNKILAYSRKPKRPKSGTLPNKYHLTSAAINRQRNQRKIDWENQILLRKIQSVKPSIKY